MRYRALLVTALSLAIIFFIIRYIVSSSTEFAWDFAINWIAATALRTGVPLYDSEALQQLGLTLIGPQMQSTFFSPYNSYIGPPTTALLYLPFTWVAFPIALILYRGLIIIIFSLAILLVGFSLLPKDRTRAWFLGVFALLLCDPVHLSIWLGQLDAWVMLALATCILAYQKERWYYAGIGVGIARLLKVSPIVIIIYFILCKRYQSAIASILTILCLLCLASVVGSTENLSEFLFVIAPTLSQGSLHIPNQSLPAYLARLFTQTTDFTTFTVGIGTYRLLSFGIAGLGVMILWYRNHKRNEHRSLCTNHR